MEDIAQHAGVSRTTVSLVLNKRTPSNGTISEETRRRVFSSASVLKYQTNELARSVVTGKNRVLGILTFPGMHHALTILTGANEVAEEQDYLLKVLHLSYNTVDKNTVARCQKWRLAGVMMFGLSDEVYRYLYREFEAVGMPFAVVDSAPRPTNRGVWGRSDDVRGIDLVVSHLVDLGHRRIAFLGADPDPLSDWRRDSFRASMTSKDLSVPDRWVRHSSWKDDPGIIATVATDLLANSADRPTAIVCANDLIAMMVQRVARSFGLHLPADLSVTGYGNREASIFTDPPLTTVDQAFHELGHTAAQKIIDFAEMKWDGGDDNRVREFTVPTRLVARESTAPPRIAAR